MRVLRSGKAGWTATSTLEEERQEALESVLTAMAAGSGDAAHAQACRYLVDHLTAEIRGGGSGFVLAPRRAGME